MTEQKETIDVSANKKLLGSWIASGWLFFFFVLFVTWWALPDGMTLALNSLSARLVFAITNIFCASLLLFVGFLAVGATRWQLETADAMVNPALSGDKAAMTSVHNRVNTQFLSNTTEQFVMFSAAVLAATPFLTTPYLRIITLMTILWIAGRFFFWGGYWYTAAHGLPTYPRAVGLGMGLLCTLVMASVAAIGICLHYPSFNAVLEPSSTVITASSGFSFADIIIRPETTIQESNLLPVVYISIVILIMPILAVFPRHAPPIIPMALISVLGWAWLLFSGFIPIR